MNKDNKLVSIIIVNFNGLHFLKELIPSIKKQTYKNIEVVVVDNHSSDKTIQYLEKKYSEIKIIKNKKNLGFAKSNNQGVQKAIGTFLLFLNNDTELFGDAVTQLVKNYQPNSILSAQQYSMRDKKSPGKTGAGMNIFGYSCHEDDISRTKIFYADGVAMFLKKSDFIRLGMFDEKLYMFQEDVDLSWRAQIYGYQIIACHKAKLYHYFGGTALLNVNRRNQYVSSYFRRYLNERNVIRNIIKNYSFPFAVIILFTLAIIHFFEMIIFLLTGNFKAVGCYLKAYAWNVVYLKDTLILRSNIQKQRKVSDWELMKRMYWQYTKFKLFLKMGLPEFK